MLRRQFLTGLLASPLGAALIGRASAKDFDDPEPFVRKLYQREVKRQKSGPPIGEQEFLGLFTRETRALWLAMRNSKAAAKFPAGPILNAFFGWGVLPGHPVEMGETHNHLGPRVLIIVVDLTIRGEQRHAYVHPVRQDGQWRISTIAYDDGDDFASYCRKRSGQ